MTTPLEKLKEYLDAGTLSYRETVLPDGTVARDAPEPPSYPTLNWSDPDSDPIADLEQWKQNYMGVDPATPIPRRRPENDLTEAMWDAATEQHRQQLLSEDQNYLEIDPNTLPIEEFLMLVGRMMTEPKANGTIRSWRRGFGDAIEGQEHRDGHQAYYDHGHRAGWVVRERFRELALVYEDT